MTIIGVEKEFFRNIWVRPEVAVPLNRQIVVVACQLEDERRIMQAAIYEQREDGQEVWHVGQPFAVLGWWLGLDDFDKLSVEPYLRKPQNGEIVVLRCELEGGHTVYQTAIYQHEEGEEEIWHCGTPFVKVNRWMSLPELPEGKLVGVKRELIH